MDKEELMVELGEFVDKRIMEICVEKFNMEVEDIKDMLNGIGEYYGGFIKEEVVEYVIKEKGRMGKEEYERLKRRYRKELEEDESGEMGGFREDWLKKVGR